MVGLLDGLYSTADVIREIHNVPVQRGGVFPFTTYGDNTTRFDPNAGLLGSAIRAFTAPARAARGEIPRDQMTEEGLNFAGNVTLGSLMGKRLSAPRGEPASTAPPKWLIEHSAQQKAAMLAERDRQLKMINELSQASPTQPISTRVYRGSESPDMIFRRYDRGYWSSDNPNVASTYAPSSNGATVAPFDVTLKRPFIFDAQGAHWTNVQTPAGPMATDEIAQFVRGTGRHDGVVFRNVRDAKAKAVDTPSDVYRIFERGTTRNPFTGELIYGGAAAPFVAGGMLDFGYDR